MEAELVEELPPAEGWPVRAEVGGFRGCSRTWVESWRLEPKRRPLLRYFPELEPLGDLLPAGSAPTARSSSRATAASTSMQADASPPRGEPRSPALGRDSGRVHRLRHPALEGKPIHREPLERRRKDSSDVPRSFASLRSATTRTRRRSGSTGSRLQASTASSASPGASVPARLPRGGAQGQEAQTAAA